MMDGSAFSPKVSDVKSDYSDATDMTDRSQKLWYTMQQAGSIDFHMSPKEELSAVPKKTLGKTNNNENLDSYSVKTKIVLKFCLSCIYFFFQRSKKKKIKILGFLLGFFTKKTINVFIRFKGMGKFGVTPFRFGYPKAERL